MVYGDEDRLDEHGHLTDPWLKPDWRKIRWSIWSTAMRTDSTNTAI